MEFVNDKNLSISDIVSLSLYFKDKYRNYKIEKVEEEHMEGALDYLNHIKRIYGSLDAYIDNFTHRNLYFKESFNSGF